MSLPAIASITTARLTLRQVTADDLKGLMTVNGDDGVTAFLPYETWHSIDDAEAWLVRMQTLAATGTAQQLVIELNRERKIIGTVLLFKFDAVSARLELGYVLGRAHWRQGLAKEALRATCTHAFEKLGVRRIEAEVNPQNIASNALLSSLGFTLEGRLRKRWIAKGLAYDTNFYGCLADDWPALLSKQSTQSVV